MQILGYLQRYKPPFAWDMKQERQGGTVTKNDILDQIFAATSKLELMQTVLSVLINTVEKEEVNTQEKALHFAANQNMIGDFLHITLEGVYFAIQALNEVYNDSEQDKERKEISELLSNIDNAWMLDQIKRTIINITKEGGK